jgi:hypothetical protein
MKTITHRADFCVVGGGLAGMSAAIAAARRGAKTVLMHDRPVLGGNASSEIRMWVCGAHGKNNRETGLVEEIHLENLWRNNEPNYSVWDSILYEKARFQPNLTLLLNCSCTAAEMKGRRIVSVKGWQTTAETWHVVEAPLFADCSGDSILAPLTGAPFRLGREAASEFNEDIEPPVADKKTMGMSCLIQARETDGPRPFVPPAWAHVYKTDADLPNRDHRLKGMQNFWWLELGGEFDSIHDTESLRDELLKVAYGIWDHIKNRGDHEAANWTLEWVGFLPGKRESRRYVGDYTLTQNDVRAEGRFDDLVAYGGWSMDDHHPAGLLYPGKPTIFHPAPSPYGIPYRCLYSKEIENLYFAGRNISVTHAAMSSTRVMATCSLLGQAVGTAAAIATAKGLSPRGVYEKEIGALKQALMDDDAYLPWNRRAVPALSREAVLTADAGDPEPLRNGIDRPVGEALNGWQGACGNAVEYRFGKPAAVREARLVFDSDLNRAGKNMPALWPLGMPRYASPATLVKAFRIDVEVEGAWKTAAKIDNNYQRLARVPLAATATAVRFVPESTWGAPVVTVFAFELS